MTEVKILKDILEVNDVIAEQNGKLFKDRGITVFNVMSSPGAGKTSLTIKTIEAVKAAGLGIAVIEGDIASAIDAERIQETGVKAIQINTGGACHLDANMIRGALKHLDLSKLDALIIENVGNLVCPAEFNLGETLRIMLFSVTEGDDKPHKYPLMFTEADALVVNKMDLLKSTNFDMAHFDKTVLGMNPDLKMFKVSCTEGTGLDEWTSYFISNVKTA